MVRHQILSFLLVSSLGPVALDLVDHDVMLFDVRRVVGVEEFIIRTTVEEGLPAHLAIMVVYRESRFEPWAWNKHSHAAGLFQLMPLTVRVLHVADPFDMRQGTLAGVGLMANYFRFGGEAYALCAMAWGTGRCANSRLEKARTK